MFSCPIWPPDWPEIGRAIEESWNSGQWGQYQSDAHDRLVTQIAKLTDCKHVRLVGSGSAAVELALRSCGVSPGDEVILSAFDYPGNLRSVEATGARPVLVDVLPGSTRIDPSSVVGAASERTKAVIVSHLYSCVAPVSEILEICRRRGWKLIEDACQNPGTAIRGGGELGASSGSFAGAGVPAGATGDIGCLSFGGTKPLTAGNGGALVSNSDQCRAKWSSLIDRPSDSHPMSALQCAALLPQIEKLDEANAVRCHAARQLARSSSRWPRWTMMAAAHFDHKPEHEAALHHSSSANPTIYKLAWQADSAELCDRVVAAAAAIGLPIGQAFRSMHKSSVKRCGKPVSLIHSESVASRTFVLAHHSLLLESSDVHLLVAAMDELYQRTAQ